LKAGNSGGRTTPPRHEKSGLVKMGGRALSDRRIKKGPRKKRPLS